MSGHNAPASELDTLSREQPSAKRAGARSDGASGIKSSAVMVSFHTGPILFDAIESVLAQNGLCDLILVDNGNEREILVEIQRRAADDPRLTLISGHGNVGFARGCNIGARRARGDLLAFINPDCVLPPGAVPRLVAEAKTLTRPWLLGCRMVNADGTDQRASRREILTPWTALAETLRLDRLMPNHPTFRRLNQHEIPLPPHTAPVPAISGAFMLLPAEDYWAVGGMDEGYFLHVEDLDFCFRFRAKGGEIYFVPDISITHHMGTSKVSIFWIEWCKTRGFVRYFRKNFSGECARPLMVALIGGIFVRFALKCAAIATARALNVVRR